MIRQTSVLGRYLISLPLNICVRRTSAFSYPRHASSHAANRRLVSPPHLLNTVATNIPMNWDDRICLQQTWSNIEKGWKVEVEWKLTPHGVGLFAAQAIRAGTILRTGVKGCNLLQFSSTDDIEAFCQNGSEDEYNPRVKYVSDYLWGFTTVGTDERGYSRGEQVERNRFYGCWIPGNGLNHSIEPNTVYRTSEAGINLVALTDIEKGNELYDDYRRHGHAPSWLLDWALAHDATLNFAECNDFVAHPDEMDY